MAAWLAKRAVDAGVPYLLSPLVYQPHIPMKSLFLLFAISTTFLLTSLVSAQDAEMEEAADSGMVRHVVVFKYSPDATEAQIQEITDALRDLKDKVPGIVSFEHGVNNSPEGKNQDFTHVYLITFENAAARDAYLPHPDHQAFGELLGGSGIFEDVFVVDYVPQD